MNIMLIELVGTGDRSLSLKFFLSIFAEKDDHLMIETFDGIYDLPAEIPSVKNAIRNYIGGHGLFSSFLSVSEGPFLTHS